MKRIFFNIYIYIYMTAYYKSSDLKNDLLPIYGDFIFRKMIEFVTIKFTKKKGAISA